MAKWMPKYAAKAPLEFAALHSYTGARAWNWREFGTLMNPKWRPRPLVHCTMSARYNPTDARRRPMLAYECRRPHGILWAFEGSNRWRR